MIEIVLLWLALAAAFGSLLAAYALFVSHISDDDDDGWWLGI